MPLSPSAYNGKTIKRSLKIPSDDRSVNDELVRIVMTMNFKRLNKIAIQLGVELGKSKQKQESGKELTKRDVALLDINRLLKILKSEYYKDIRQYAVLFTAFNFLEDTARAVANEKYYETSGRLDWHRDTTLWPQWVNDKIHADPNKLSRMLRYDTAASFLEDLEFGALLSFISCETAWDKTAIPSLYAARTAEKDVLPAMTRENIEEHLAILQRCRNLIFHHKIVPNPLRFYINDKAFEVSAGPDDVLTRIALMLKYLGVDMNRAMGELNSKDDH